MAIALLGSGGTSAGVTSSDLTLSYSSHNGTYRKMIVICTTVADTATGKVAGVKYNNVSLDVVDLWGGGGDFYQMDTSTTYKNMHAYYLDDADFPAAGAHNLVADVTASILSIAMVVIELSGCEQGLPEFETNDPGVSDENLLQVETTLDNTWLISGQWVRKNVDVTPTSGQTIAQEINVTTANSLALTYHNISPADATADSNYEYALTYSNFQVCFIVPPAIIPNRNSAILSATF